MNQELSTLREKFHKIANLLTHISLGSGSSLDALDVFFKKYPELKNEPLIEEVRRALEKMERASMDINKIILKIKEFVYKKIDPDTEID